MNNTRYRAKGNFFASPEGVMGGDILGNVLRGHLKGTTFEPSDSGGHVLFDCDREPKGRSAYAEDFLRNTLAVAD
jgi:hypothetical protein